MDYNNNQPQYISYGLGLIASLCGQTTVENSNYNLLQPCHLSLAETDSNSTSMACASTGCNSAVTSRVICALCMGKVLRVFTILTVWLGK